MRYWYCILLHAWHILLLNIPLCNIHIAFCYMNVTFGYMPFVNLIFYYAILMLYFAKWIVAHGCIMRHCIMRYESSIRRDVFCSVVFRFMNEPGRLLVRHLMDKCFYQSAQSASLLWVTILYIFYEFKHTSYPETLRTRSAELIIAVNTPKALGLSPAPFKMTKAKTPEWQVSAFGWKNCLA